MRMRRGGLIWSCCDPVWPVASQGIAWASPGLHGISCGAMSNVKHSTVLYVLSKNKEEYYTSYSVAWHSGSYKDSAQTSIFLYRETVTWNRCITCLTAQPAQVAVHRSRKIDGRKYLHFGFRSESTVWNNVLFSLFCSIRTEVPDSDFKVTLILLVISVRRGMNGRVKL
jgi:hypothetical protein